MTARRLIAFPAVAILGMAANPAVAQEVSDEVRVLITPLSSYEIGILGAIDEPNAAGMYSGLNDMDAFPIIDGSYVTRDDKTGTWIRVEGNNIGLSSRDFRMEYERQGNWKTYLKYSQTPKSNPLNVITPLSGLGSSQQLTTGSAKREITLSTDRYHGEFGLKKRINKNLDFKLSYSSEYKEGDRQFGLRTGGSNIFFVADPVDYWHHEANAVLNYTTPRLQLAGGTLISLFVNKHKALGNDTTLSNISLPMDNQAYKVFLDGAYKLTPTTQGTFKFSYNLMLQDENFFRPPNFPGNNQGDLGGEVHNYLGQVALTSRPTTKLTLRAKARYEGRHDDTPVNKFIDGSPTRDGNNVVFTRETFTADGEASYRLPMDFRLIGFLKYEDWSRTFPPIRQMSWREDTDEIAGGARLRRMFTDTLGGDIGYSYAKRDGSDFLQNGFGNIRIDPIHWGDRDRHKFSVTADWSPMAKLSLQGRVDASLDAYNALPLGPRDGRSVNAAIDASYALSRDWSLTGWLSRNEVYRDQAQFDGAQFWAAELTSLGYAAGIGVRGQPTGKLKLGADMQYAYDKNEYELDPISGSAINDLPDFAYRQFDFNLWADYALSDRGSVKASYTFTHLENGDWGYDGWVYNDGTVISVPEQENAHFIGVSYRYQW
jgi:MtrB/PioB family decaheme-associated outer membrane protein